MQEKNCKCCFCNAPIIGWGNNPWPADNNEEARCCDTCNMKIVIPTRIIMLKQD